METLQGPELQKQPGHYKASKSSAPKAKKLLPRNRPPTAPKAKRK